MAIATLTGATELACAHAFWSKVYAQVGDESIGAACPLRINNAPRPSGLELPLWLRVLGCLPLRGAAGFTDGRRPRSLQVGNRGPARLGVSACYGDSGPGGCVWIDRMRWKVSAGGTRRSPRRRQQGLWRVSRAWNGVSTGVPEWRMVERHRSRWKTGDHDGGSWDVWGSTS